MLRVYGLSIGNIKYDSHTSDGVALPSCRIGGQNRNGKVGRVVGEDEMKTLKKGTAHEVYTPKAEVDICLTCPLKSCNKNECERFRNEKRKLIKNRGAKIEYETRTLADDRKGV